MDNRTYSSLLTDTTGGNLDDFRPNNLTSTRSSSHYFMEEVEEVEVVDENPLYQNRQSRRANKKAEKIMQRNQTKIDPKKIESKIRSSSRQYFFYRRTKLMIKDTDFNTKELFPFWKQLKQN